MASALCYGMTDTTKQTPKMTYTAEELLMTSYDIAFHMTQLGTLTEGEFKRWLQLRKAARLGSWGQ